MGGSNGQCKATRRRPAVYHTHGFARAKMSPHLAFFRTAGTARAYDAADTGAAADADADACMWGAAGADGDASTLIGAPTDPLPTTRTVWSS